MKKKYYYNKVFTPEYYIYYLSTATPQVIITPTSNFFGQGVTLIRNEVDPTDSSRCRLVFDSLPTIIGEGLKQKTALKYIIIPNSVTSIFSNAFYSDSYLTDVIIENGVTSIGVTAFYRCTRLNNIQLGNQLNIIKRFAFSMTSDLTSISLPNSLNTIEKGVFSNSGLTSITIPSSVSSIESAICDYCKNLAVITVNNSNLTYDSRDNCNAIIETATNILILGCKNTIIPNTVYGIGEEAFKGHTGLTSLIIPNSVINIDNNAFNDCSNLASINIPNSVTNISYNVFDGCESLSSITIPNSVTSIGTEIFAGCVSLSSIVVDNNNNVYDSRNSCNAIIETATNTLIAGCKNTIIPNDIVNIKKGAFINNRSLISISIPSSVTALGDYVFGGCDNLTTLKCYAETPPSVVNAHLVNSPNNIILYVPANSVSAYQVADGWKDCNSIQALS